MKKIILMILAAVLMASVCIAGLPGSFELYKGLPATGTYNTVDLPRSVDRHTVAIKITDADTSISAVTVVLEGSADGTNFYALATHTFSAAEITALQSMFHVKDKPVSYVRINVSTMTGADAADSMTALYIAG